MPRRSVTAEKVERLAGFGVRLEDWEQALRECVGPKAASDVMQRVAQIARGRNRRHANDPDVSGRCATHGGTTDGRG